MTVADDMSGESVQCPKCGLLVDVPLLDELQNLDSDGVIKVGPRTTPDAHRDGRRRDVPSVTRKDDPSDRRMTLDEVLEVDRHVDEVNQPQIRSRPLYDPLTGELIEPLQISRAERSDSVKRPSAGNANVGARPNGSRPGSSVLGYARGPVSTDIQGKPANFLSIWFLMFAPMNVIVWVLIASIIGGSIMLSMVPLAGVLFAFLLGLPIICALMGHFGNIVDETGPVGRDELPTPLRHASIREDILDPMVSVAVAGALAFSPLLSVIAYAPRLPAQVYLAFIVLGFCVLPALLITKLCSGYFMNVLPHRSLPLMWICGVWYWWSALVLMVAIIVFMLGAAMSLSFGMRIGAIMIAPSGSTVSTPTMFGMSYQLEMILGTPTLFVGVFLLHAACWHLGMLYRKFYPRFPWLMQRHISTRTDVAAQLVNMRRNGTVAVDTSRTPAPTVRTGTGPSR